MSFSDDYESSENVMRNVMCSHLRMSCVYRARHSEMTTCDKLYMSLFVSLYISLQRDVSLFVSLYVSLQRDVSLFTSLYMYTHTKRCVSLSLCLSTSLYKTDLSREYMSYIHT